MQVSPAQAPLELTVNRAIKLTRQRQGWSQRELGRRSGMSVSYVNALEAGAINPSLRAFARLAMQLRLSPLEIQTIITAESQRALETPGAT